MGVSPYFFNERGAGMATVYTKGRIYKLDLTTLKSDPNQPRTCMDPEKLAELEASVRKHGVKQPILFRQNEAGEPVIVAGERRVAASRKAGLKTIPGILVTENFQEIALVENLLREDLTPLQEAEAMDRIMKDHSYSQVQLSEMIGKTQPMISQIISLTRLPDDVKSQCRTNPNIPRYLLTEIARKKSEKSMRTAFERYMAKTAKEQAPKTPGKARQRSELVLIQQLDHLNGRLVNLEIDNWEEADREDLAVVLRDLRQTADDLLGHLPGQEEERDESESGPSMRLS